MNTPRLPHEAGALEAMEHLKQKICLMWGSPELDIFISHLIMDSRDGQRQGLPMEVGVELLFLAQTNKMIRALDLIGKRSMPLKDAYRIVDAGDQKRLEGDVLDNPLVSHDTVIHESGDNRRSGRERRDLKGGSSAHEDGAMRHHGQQRQQTGDGAVAFLGKLVFRLVTNKAVLFLIAAALTVKLLWPYLAKLAG